MIPVSFGLRNSTFDPVPFFGHSGNVLFALVTNSQLFPGLIASSLYSDTVLSNQGISARFCGQFFCNSGSVFSHTAQNVTTDT